MDHPPPKESRAPINLRIKFRSESLDQFIDRYSIDVSRGGIFIRTREPLAVGTQLKFDFQLQDASPLMAGEGTVVWIREYDANRTGITPGMGVRFDKLTAASQPILEKILAEKGRREQGNQSGGIMSKVGAGMAVRRPSSTFTALDPRALGLVAGGPGGSGETPVGGASTSDSVTRRERRPSAPTLTPAAPPSTMSAAERSAAERTHQGFAASPASPTTSSPVTNPERTHMGGFGAPGSPGYPPPMTLPSAVPQRPRTPGPLPALETAGSGRHTTGSDVPSLVSRLTASRPASYEPPTSADIDKALDGLTGGADSRPAAPPAGRPSSIAAADNQGVPGLNEDEAPSEPTKTGDALSDVVIAATMGSSVESAAAAAAAAAAASGVVDGAAPSAEIDSDRTQATSADHLAEMLGSERTAAGPKKTEKDLPALSDAEASAALSAMATATTATPSPATAPSLTLVKSDAVAKDDATVKADPIHADAVSPDAAAGLAAAVSANSAQSPTAAGSFTAGKLAGVAANTVGVAPGAPPEAGRSPTAAGAAAKTGSARPAKRRSAAPFVVAGLIGAAAIVAVVVSQQGAQDHSGESFQARKPESNPAPGSPTPAAPAAVAEQTPAPAATAVTPPPAAEPAKPAEPVKAGESAATTAIPAPEATTPPPSPSPSSGAAAEAKAAPPTVARAEKEKSKGAGPKAGAERKPTVAVVGPPRKTAATAAATVSAADSAPADEAGDASKKASPGAGAGGQKSAVQHLLKITSSPPGADVLIDGQSVGKTPYQARELDADAPHAVTIRLDGYESHEHMISASDWLKQKANLETAKVNVKLRKLAAGPATESTAARSDSAAAEPPKAEAAIKTESPPAEKAPEATPAPSATEPPKAKDEPAAAPAR